MNKQLLTFLPELAWLGTKGALRQQRLRDIETATQIKFNSRFALDDGLIEGFKKRFPHTTAIPPFQYHWTQWIRFYLRFGEHSGLRLSGVRLIGQDFEFIDLAHLKAGCFNYEGKLIHVFRKRGDQLIAVTESTVLNENSEPVLRTREFGIAFLAPTMEGGKLDKLPALPEEYVKRFEGASSKTGQLQRQSADGYQEFTLDSVEGLKFTALTGDPTFIHSNRILSPLFGFPHAFIQGCWISNYVLGSFDSRGLDRTTITLCRPLIIGQKHALIWKNHDFEITNVDGDRLIVFGTTT